MRPSPAPTAALVRTALRAKAKPAKVPLLSSFFKTGRGQYAEGDRFIGVVVPEQRKIAKEFRGLPHAEALKLLHSPVHEERMTALLIWVLQFEKGAPADRERIAKAYLANAKHINNWDLVDVTCPRILGAWLLDKDRSILNKLAGSKLLWERRMAMLACFQFIYKGESQDALRIAKALLHDEHDLIHKAVGWMLREVGKRASLEALRGFLKAHAHEMPRTMLRYAIERLGEEERKMWMGRKAT